MANKFKKFTAYECISCGNIYKNYKDVQNCGCDKLCSGDMKGRHSWIWKLSIKSLGVAFYECKNCGKEIIGKTQKIGKLNKKFAEVLGDESDE